LDAEIILERPAGIIMRDPIYSILERITAIESELTPVGVKQGLNKQQKSVKQMPALFKPRDISPVLTAKKDPQHPAHGLLVGASESQGMASEDVLSQTRRGLADYLASIEAEKRDRDLSDRPADRELGKRARDRDIVARVAMEDPTQSNPVTQAPSPVETYPTLPEGTCVKSMTMEDGTVMEIHGDDATGYGVRCGTRGLKTRFENMSDAEMACEMYQARSRVARPAQDLSQDYVEEA
jgi:hypothetical protein